MNKEKQFWDWFIEHEDEFFAMYHIKDDEEREPFLNDFQQHLHRYSEGLFFEMGGLEDDEQELIITAGGDTDFFDDVEALVAAAPDLKRWKVTAFKPAAGVNKIVFNGVTLDGETMRFNPLESKASTKVGVRLFTDNYQPERRDDFINAAYLLIDGLIGEKATALDIGYVDVALMPNDQEREEFIEVVNCQGIWPGKKPKDKSTISFYKTYL